MVDSCPESPGLEEMNAVQIGYVHPSVEKEAMRVEEREREGGGIQHYL